MRQSITIPISGMSCANCVTTVRSALEAVPSIRVSAVSIGAATVSYDASVTTPTALARAIQLAGYQPVPANSQAFAGPNAGRHHCCGG